MRILAFASQKGGVGKTTLAGHLAVAAERTNAGPAALIDADPQGSLAAWWNEREAERPLFARAQVRDLTSQLNQLRVSGVRLVMIDTPPNASDQVIGTVVRASHLIVIPTRPSPHDLRSLGATVSLVRAAGKPMVFVINGAPIRARITAEAAVALSQHGPVAPALIHQRVAYASTMTNGLTVLEAAPDSKASAEIMDLWTYVNQQLNTSARAKVKHAKQNLAIE
ncbi:MAG TPA: ParA family protein [Candidatus Saccharimonadia bacterium]|nr:ParA family protein [Candidatus Saccharimonadia bacterium]